MARKTPGTHSDLIRCSACGEDYASSYKRCPFCGDKHSQPQAAPAPEDEYVFEGGYIFDEIDAEKEESMQQTRGGKRLDNGGRPAGKPAGRPAGRPSGKRPRDRSIWEQLNITPVRVIGFFFTLLIIIGAIMIVTKVILPMISRGSVDVPPSEPNTSHSQPVEEGPDASPDPSEDPVEGDPSESDPAETDSPEPTEEIPADQTATGLTLSHSEFSISDKYPAPVKVSAILSPAGSSANVTWSSSDESVATVSQSGVVTGVGKGKATITASIPGGAEATCLVRCSLTGSSSSESSEPSEEPSESPSGSSDPITLSREDFTLSETHPTYTFEVTGGSGSITWTSSDESVATVSASGKVTRVGKGKCTVTATDANGSTAKCIVRCS